MATQTGQMHWSIRFPIGSTRELPTQDQMVVSLLCLSLPLKAMVALAPIKLVIKEDLKTTTSRGQMFTISLVSGNGKISSLVLARKTAIFTSPSIPSPISKSLR